MAAFVGGPRKRRNAGSNRAQHISEVCERIARGHWAEMTAGRLVALYWIMHEKIYGITPTELNKAAAWERAMKSAGKMVKDNFDGDVGQAVQFMRWVWTEAMRKEKWARDNEKNVRRITWQNQFMHDYLITDWRASEMRKRAR